MYASIKTYAVRAFVLALVCYSVLVTALAFDLYDRWFSEVEAKWNCDAILVMASQALTEEERMNVVDCADCQGDSDAIDSLKWDFVHNYPMYHSYNPIK